MTYSNFVLLLCIFSMSAICVMWTMHEVVEFVIAMRERRAHGKEVH